MNILYHKSLSLKVSKIMLAYCREPILVYSCDSWIVRKFRCEGGCASQTRRWRSYNWEQHSEMIKSKHDLYEMWNHVVLQDGWAKPCCSLQGKDRVFELRGQATLIMHLTKLKLYMSRANMALVLWRYQYLSIRMVIWPSWVKPRT